MHKREGTLWAQRFKSVVVENEPSVIAKVAAYIDLNPVRAGLVTDPKDYRWCGYAEAAAGGRLAQRGLLKFLDGKTWKTAGASYRQMLFLRAGISGNSGKAALNRESILAVVARNGELTLAETLRLRIRYFSAGTALGSRAFVNGIHERFKEYFGPNRQTGARPLRGLKALADLYCLRDLQRAPYS